MKSRLVAKKQTLKVKELQGSHMLQEEFQAEIDAGVLQAKKARNRFELRKAALILQSLKGKLDIRLQAGLSP